MFKMGCSMARKILGPGSGGASNEQLGGASSSSPGNNNNAGASAKKRANENSAGSRPAPIKTTDELGDFSKLEEDPRLPLNVRQIFKITKSWKAIARTMSKTGTAMFLNLFEQNQDLFYLFDRFQHLKGKELHESMELREHAATVMSTLDQSINSLCDYDNFVSYLHSIGQLHRKVPGFRREYFWKIEQPFMKAVKQTLDERCNETIEQIYMIAIKLIIEMIAEGYGQDEEAQDAQRELELTRGGGGGGSGGGSGGGAGGESGGAPGRGSNDAPDGRGRPNVKPRGQEEGEEARSNENNRATFAGGRQQARSGMSAAGSAAVERLACPLARSPAGPPAKLSSDRASESDAIAGQTAAELEPQDGAADEEGDSILVRATCELMRETSSWLAGQAGQESDVTGGAGQLRQLFGSLNERLLADDNNLAPPVPPGEREDDEPEQTRPARSQVNKENRRRKQEEAEEEAEEEEARKTRQNEEFSSTTKTTTTTTRQDSRGAFVAADAIWRQFEKGPTSASARCPLNPATQLDEWRDEAAVVSSVPAKHHQVITTTAAAAAAATSSCPAGRKPASANANLGCGQRAESEANNSRRAEPVQGSSEPGPIVKREPEPEPKVKESKSSSRRWRRRRRWPLWWLSWQRPCQLSEPADCATDSTAHGQIGCPLARRRPPLRLAAGANCELELASELIREDEADGASTKMDQQQQREQQCNNDNKLASSWAERTKPQVTGREPESNGRRASGPDNQRSIPRDHDQDHHHHRRRRPADCGGPSERAAPLIKSESEASPTSPPNHLADGKVNRLAQLAGWLKSAWTQRWHGPGAGAGARTAPPKCCRHRLAKGRDLDRQSRNNNKSEITTEAETNCASRQAQDDHTDDDDDDASSPIVAVNCDDRGAQCKQGRPVKLDRRQLDQVIPNDSARRQQRERQPVAREAAGARQSWEHPAPTCEAAGLLHKSERAIVKLLAGDDERARPAAARGELAELIKVLLLINRLLLTLAEGRARPGPLGERGQARPLEPVGAR